MGLEDINAKIRRQGRKQVEEVRAAAREKINAITREVDGHTRQKLQKMAVDYAKKSSSMRGSILSNARMQASHRIAMEKSRLIGGVFSAARERILEMPASEKKKIMSSMLADLPLIHGKPVVLVEKQYSGMLPKSRAFDVKTEDIGDFGLILTSSDGSVKIDKRISSMLAALSDQMAPELCRILFKEK